MDEPKKLKRLIIWNGGSRILGRARAWIDEVVIDEQGVHLFCQYN